MIRTMPAIYFADDSAATAPSPEAPAAAAPTDAPDASAPSDDLPELPEGQDTFDRAYVEKLRNEAAEKRVALKNYEGIDAEQARRDRAALETLSTPEGLVAGFMDIANALSISGKEAEDFLNKALDIAEDQVEDEADAAGETLTQAQIDERVNAILQEKVLNPMKEQEEEQFAGQVRTRIDGVFDKHAIPAEDRQFLVAAAGDALPDETRDLDAIEAAVEKAIEAYDARIEERVQSHLKAKKETAAASPTVLKGGGSGAGDGTAAKEEPRSIKDVIRARREGKVKVGQ